jgi:hypothetical protein
MLLLMIGSRRAHKRPTNPIWRRRNKSTRRFNKRYIHVNLMDFPNVISAMMIG